MGRCMRILSCIATEHNLLLVALAAVICTLGAWTAIRLFRRARTRDGSARLPWILFGAVAAGSSVWCTHFVAMLAFEAQAPVAYDPGLTGLSLLVVILSSAAAFSVGALRMPYAPEIGGAVFGLGVAAMHYTGMAAFSIEAVVQWSTAYLFGSVAWSTAVAAFAFNRAAGTDPARAQGGATAALVASVVGLHFGGMAAMTIVPLAPDAAQTTSAAARQMLAFAVAGVGLLVVGIVWVSHFMDRQMRQQAAERLRHLAGSSADGIVIEQASRIIEVNAAFERLSGLSRLELIGRGVADAGVAAERLQEGTVVRSELAPADGEPIPVEIVVSTESGKHGEAALRVYALRDIRPRLDQERRIARLARTDGLTGLPNRTAFLEHLERTLEEAKGEGQQMALVAIDLNRFKEVNDLYGHAAGDAVLKVLSSRMKDLLADGEVLARLGGDEFVVLRRRTDRDGASDLAKRMETALFSIVPLEESDVICGGSIGIALFPEHSETPTGLMNNADLAMYRAKDSHTERICFYEPEMDDAMRDRRRMVQQLRAAIAREEFELRFQVQVSTATEGLTGYEVLLRWKHPERGYVSPAEFIPVAEESGLIIPIGAWVLREACKRAAGWKEPYKIAVNLSAVQLAQLDFPCVVKGILEETGLSPDRLELEITETCLMKDPARTVHILTELKALGVTIAMDDFGTGYSSLSTLRAFPFDKIKLDKTFVDDVTSNSQARAVMLAVIALGNGLGIPVLAEGVETRDQLLFLRASGCEEVQGFLFGRPMPSITPPTPTAATDAA